MNIIKIGLVLLTGAGFGFGIDQLADTEETTPERSEYYGHMARGYCHNDEFFLEHMLEELSEEENTIVQEKIDEMLITYDISLDELYDNYEVRYEFMEELMNFLEENDISYHNHGEHHYDEENDTWFGGMGMH